MPAVGPNATFKWLTFPEYDLEEEMLKLEGWLCLIWDGEDPVGWVSGLG